MRNIAIIGSGAIAEAVAGYLAKSNCVQIGVAIIEPGMDSRARDIFGKDIAITHNMNDTSGCVDLAVDCAGHPALRQHGEAILSQGIDLVTVSSGALADSELYDRLAVAAHCGGTQLRVVSGAIGALDALSAGSVGSLNQVTYRGRKPPRGWRGSAAEAKLDLNALREATVHFSGSARSAALEYPKNANVAAAVALAGIGFEETQVALIADPTVTTNIHEVSVDGEFGNFQFTISGNGLPENPRSSALAAMSVVSELVERKKRIGF